MEYNLIKNVKENTSAREGFLALAQNVFGLQFENWYNKGYWTNAYQPYLLTCGEKAVANISANIMHTYNKGALKTYIQIGTVMTDPEFRGKGLSRMIMEKLLTDWAGKCHGIYLFANDKVLDFYPKFGFIPCNQFQHTMTVKPKPQKMRKLNPDNGEDLEIIKICYEKSNPYSQMPMLENFPLLMYYLLGSQKENIYYWEEAEALIIAEYKENIMTCFDIFTHTNLTLQEILSAVAHEKTDTVFLGFTPIKANNFTCIPLEDHGTMFYYKEGENLFAEEKMMMPFLSRA